MEELGPLGNNFYMGTQNGRKLEVWWRGIVDSRLWIEVMALWSFPYVCIGKPYVCNVFRSRVGVVMRTYRIAGNFRWCKFSYIWPKSPQNKFSYVLISHARATRPRLCSSPMAYSTAWWSRSRFMSLFSFCFDRTTDQESLSRPLKDLAQL